MYQLVKENKMKNAGRLIAEEYGEFLRCDEEELQTLLDGPSNPYYWDVYDNLNPILRDGNILIISEDSVFVTTSEEERVRYGRIID